MVKRKQTPMYWQNGSYASKTGHKIERDLDPWVREQYAKHHPQKSGAFFVEERLGKDAQKVKASSDGDQ
ncbi:hypothetical protein [Levilactobacillus brevis]|uniref:hypothetical protein n=1 Tax=Levilactobacillus brevis TaxID=1580 RepID=UPI00345E3DEC